MKIKFLQINSLFFILFSITCFQLNANASLNPLKWFSSKSNSSQVIELENDHEKGTQGLIKKLAKTKSKGSQTGQQRIYKKILINHPRASIAKEAAYNRGYYLFNKGKWKDAFEAFSVLKIYHPDFQELDSVIKLQFQCAENLMNQESNKVFGFKSSYSLNEDSIPLFLKYTKLYPHNENAPQALLLSAKVAKANKENEAAIYSLKDLINSYPESPYSAEAYFIIAHIYSEFIKGPEYDLESTREAIRYCEDFIALYPGHKEIGTIEALYERMLNALATNRVLLADYYYFNQRDNVAAIIFYNEAITIAPNSQAAIEAQERLYAIEIGIRPTTGRNFIKKLFFIK